MPTLATVTASCTVAIKESAPPAAPRRGFFEGSLPAGAILGAFPFLTVPVAIALIRSSDHRFLWVYVWLFGISHFVLTPSVYLRSENLKHFAASGRNIFLYFVAPLAILMGFYAAGVLQLRYRFPLAAIAAGAAIRLLDFNHLNRQTFGVYQLFKARTGVRPPASTKRLENAYFACLTALLLSTFLAGGTFPFLSGAQTAEAILPIGLLRIASAVLSFAALSLGACCVVSMIRAWKAAGRPGGILEALAYLAFQSAAALLAVISSPLYFASLAMHYVEYHVLMFPRCFHTGVDETSALDRLFAHLRANRMLFYGMVAAASGLVAMLLMMQTNPTDALRTNPTRYLAVVSIFDGLFVFHYFVEMLIWRFSDPFFRKTLSPLYFAPKSRQA